MSEETKVKKPFFKSVSFKCIVVLLVIALISGLFLTACNAIFNVSDEERLERALAKLYTDGETVSNPTKEEIDESITIKNATISTVYKISSLDGEYVLDVTGTGGFSGGSVTCYIRVYVDEANEVCEVKSISISSNSGQSYISKIDSGDLADLVAQQSSDGFTSFSTDGITCGATFSLTAISNAANAALTYMNAKYLNITTSTAYDNFDYIEYIDTSKTTHVVDGNVVTYTIVTESYTANPFTIEITVDNTETVVSYEITTNGSTADSFTSKMYDTSAYVGMSADEILALLDIENDIVSSSDLKTGASYSNYLCAYAALFATANYQNCIDAEVSE